MTAWVPFFRKGEDISSLYPILYYDDPVTHRWIPFSTVVIPNPFQHLESAK